MANEKKGQEFFVFNVHKNRVERRIPQTLFDLDEAWIYLVTGIIFVLCAITSGYATFAGIHAFLEEIGDIGLRVSGTALLITIAVVAILAAGWSLICRYGPEARTGFLKFAVAKLAVLLLVMTLSVSSLPNMVMLAGGAAKVADWKHQLQVVTVLFRDLSNRSLGVVKLRPTWLAEKNKACGLADAETDGGLVSEAGGGVGPVATALVGACAQTTSFIESGDQAVAETNAAKLEGQAALAEMRAAIRDRASPIIEREDRFVRAADVLNAAIDRIRAADLSGTLDAGAAQIGASIAELSPDSTFTPKQIEMVRSLKQGLDGLVKSTEAITVGMGQVDLSNFRPIEPLDYIGAIIAYGDRYIPAVAAAVGIDLFQIWCLFFFLTMKGGRDKHRLRGDFDHVLQTDVFAVMAAEANGLESQKKRKRFRFLRRRNSRLNT